MTFVSKLKQMVVAPGRRPRRILTGPFRNIAMNLQLESQTQIYLGLFERETYPWLNRLSAGITAGIDIGAAYGEYTLFLLLKTAARVYAFEPSSESLAFLDDNLKLNGVAGSDRLKVINVFLGSDSSAETVQLDSLTDVLTSPCLIKMDVDGSEAQILKGASRVNQLPGVRWLIETHSKELETSCIETLTKAGFSTKVIPNAGWRIIIPEMRPIPHNRWLAAWKKTDLPDL